MIEELFDLLHCYPASHHLRVWKQAFTKRAVNASQRNWIRDYEEEEQAGIAILQRRIFVEEEMRAAQKQTQHQQRYQQHHHQQQQQKLQLQLQKTQLHEDDDIIRSDDTDVDVDDDGNNNTNNDVAVAVGAATTWAKEFSALNQKYFLHQQALHDLLKAKPRGAQIREWEVNRCRARKGWRWTRMSSLLLRRQAREESELCAVRGGCCGRGCGCCEKSLARYHIYQSSGHHKKSSSRRFFVFSVSSSSSSSSTSSSGEGGAGGGGGGGGGGGTTTTTATGPGTGTGAGAGTGTGTAAKKTGTKELYGHCTVDCPCCTRFRGFHKPDASVVEAREEERKAKKEQQEKKKQEKKGGMGNGNQS
ncbi:hypothetical protein VTN96DRAFT_2690 [Rasamsonia emersonii]